MIPVLVNIFHQLADAGGARFVRGTVIALALLFLLSRQRTRKARV
jgi:hypothetical protein